MKKLIFKVLIAVVIMVGLSNYGLYLTTGKTPFANMSFSSLFANTSLDDLKPELPKGNDTAYKWTDENGLVHYSSEPPSDSETAKRLDVDPDVNMIQGIEPSSPAASAPQAPQTPQLSNPYSAEGIQQTLDKARNVQKILDERHEKQKKLMGD
ncbi:protein of unknown function [Alteromonadaceae bacterium Bs31]|nr:protein of unknown function [Alteromonadaceae bacterium Bs31]